MTRDAVLIGSAAIDAALGGRASMPIAVSVGEDAYRYLRTDPGWVRAGSRLVRDEVSVEMGWGRLSHTELTARAWKLPGDVGVAALPMVYAQILDSDDDHAARLAARIRERLHDPAAGPLPRYVAAWENAALAATLPDGVAQAPGAGHALALAANGLLTLSTLYGDPRRGRVGQIIGTVELPAYQVAATYHHAGGVLADLVRLHQHLRTLRATPADHLAAMAAEVYSDVVYGHGRCSNNPTSYDELRSADLAAAHALALDIDPDTAARVHRIVAGTGFDERTRTQSGAHDVDTVVQAVAGIDLAVLARPESVTATIDLAVEDLMSARYSPTRILGRALQQSGVQVRSTSQALAFIDEYADMRPRLDGQRPAATSVREAFAQRIIGNAAFTEGHRYPPTWTLDDPGQRAENATTARELGRGLLTGRLTARHAYTAAAEHHRRWSRSCTKRKTRPSNPQS
ncbi:hypothetical protein ACQP2U_43595 (plasmid) [Nocardia sp. CA-084685]|uniref:hypothetical protein n=1 Tax=Nocardia sp. CA-084685 TaxID=3239970 RepID=UPI003D977662